MSKLIEFGNTLNGKAICAEEGIYPAYGGNGIISFVNQYNYPENTIIIGRVGANCGSVHFSETKCWVTDNALAFVANKDSDPYYLYYLLKYINLNKYHIGSSQPLITQSIINDIDVGTIHSLKDQKNVAMFLKKIDSKIQVNNKYIDVSESFAKTIYDYWFLQFDFPNEDGKPYKSSGGKMIWNNTLNRDIPEGWDVTDIGNITECLDSKRIPLSSKERENMKGLYPYYGATGIMDNVDDYLFDGDYVLLAEDGSVMDENGFPILQRASGKVWVNNHAHVLQPKKLYGCKLLMFILKNIPIAMIKTGSIQMKVNQENLNTFKILNIPENLIEKVNTILNPIDSKIIKLKQENQKLTSLRDFLLPMLMNGQVTFKESL